MSRHGGSKIGFTLVSFALLLSSALAFGAINPVPARIPGGARPQGKNADVRLAQAPDNTLALTLETIASAKQSLKVNIYDMRSKEVVNALLESIRSGVQVEILQEGQPVGGLSAASKVLQAEILKEMKKAGGRNRYVEMASSGRKSDRRFRFNHAKYIVVDDRALMIGSENYSPGSQPVPGSVGGRGWQVRLHDLSVIQDFATIFAQDSDPAQTDIRNLMTEGSAPRGHLSLSLLSAPGACANSLFQWGMGWNGDLGCQESAIESFAASMIQGTAKLFARPVPVPTLTADSIQKITSPDTSLDGILTLINSAQKTLDLELMSLDTTWGDKQTESPLFRAIVNAARRGAQVRVLMTDETLFYPSGAAAYSKNRSAMKLLNWIAAKDNLPLHANVADLRAMGISHIHNKGALVDGHKTLISSVNWNKTSVTLNREAAVVIHGRAINAHYQEFFDKDWVEAAKHEPDLSKLKDSPKVPLEADGAPAPEGIRMVRPQGLNAGLALARPFAESTCPGALKVGLYVGDLNLKPTTDSSFGALENSLVELRFVRKPDTRGCILVDADADINLGERIVEIRNRRGGGISMRLEGYTSAGKHYFVRAVTEPDSENLKGGISLPASIYDDSGAGPHKLGGAVMEILHLDPQ